MGRRNQRKRKSKDFAIDALLSLRVFFILEVTFLVPQQPNMHDIIMLTPLDIYQRVHCIGLVGFDTVQPMIRNKFSKFDMKSHSKTHTPKATLFSPLLPVR